MQHVPTVYHNFLFRIDVGFRLYANAIMNLVVPDIILVIM